MRNTAYFQQANGITSVIETMKQERINMIQEVKSSEMNIMKVMEMNIMKVMQMTQDHFDQKGEQRDDIKRTFTPTQKANSATTDVIQLGILKLLKEMRQDNKTFKKTNNNNSDDKNNNNNNKNNTNINNNNNNKKRNQQKNKNRNNNDEGAQHK